MVIEQLKFFAEILHYLLNEREKREENKEESEEEYEEANVLFILFIYIPINTILELAINIINDPYRKRSDPVTGNAVKAEFSIESNLSIEFIWNIKD
ncbi:hypothetical protein Glove_600g8 [Diversispora epigaea]|uniref:Uncharacterized protein n=1 Tax=Diversispora epigaea TaxID=1348612 RepID=A0A397GC40_9GLOM|nr:hypothetical protein Glove_600g8 [Diversispora epigaea]